MQQSFHYTHVLKYMLDKVIWLALPRSCAAYRTLTVLPHSLCLLCCRNYKVVLENPGAEDLGLTFSVPATDVVGQNTERELFPGSGEIQVTDTNKEVYAAKARVEGYIPELQQIDQDLNCKHLLRVQNGVMPCLS